jgi:hypothetical protein
MTLLPLSSIPLRPDGGAGQDARFVAKAAMARHSVEILRPIEEVFDIVTDVTSPVAGIRPRWRNGGRRRRRLMASDAFAVPASR